MLILVFATSAAFGFDYPDAGLEARRKCFSDNGVAVPAKDNATLVDAAKTKKLAVFQCVHEKGASLNSFEMVLLNRTLTGDGKWEAGPEKEGTVWPIEVAIRDNSLDIVEYVLTRVTRIYSSDEQWRREEALDFAYKYRNEQAKIVIRRLIQRDLEKWYGGRKMVLKFFSDIPYMERVDICRTAKNVNSCMDFPGFMFYALDSK
jgi:hypothetical protein